MRWLFLPLLWIAVSVPVCAAPTEIEIRVLSRGAKFIGTSMGGAAVRIEDADSGALLAEGVTQGGTGDTERIMRTPLRRGDAIANDEAAAFRVTLDIDTPRTLRVTATGPLRPAAAANTVSATQIVLPGRHLTGGDGWVLEIPGFVVELLASEPLAGGLRLRAQVRMMCGCPLTPGGLWDANGVDVRAVLVRDGQTTAAVPLAYGGEPSLFDGVLTPPDPGAYLLRVEAYDAANGNSGIATMAVDVGPAGQ